MQKFRKNTVTIILLLIVMLGITGCWNRRELDTLAFVSGLGIDKAREPGKLQLTAQIIKPGEIKAPEAGGGGKGGSKPYWNISQIGNTVFSTVREITLKSNRKLFFPHNEVIIFSQDIAREGVRKYIDFLIRDPEFRRLSWIVVAKDKASEVLETKTELAKLPARNIAELIKARSATSEVSAVNMQEFLTRLMSKTTAPIASLIEVSAKEKTAQLTGTAVFKDDKLVGFLNKTETRGLLWVINEIKSGIITVNCPDGKGKASLEIIQASSKIKPEIKDNDIYITVEVKAEGHLGSQMCLEDLTQIPAWNSLEKRQSEAIRSEVLAALKRARQLNADIFGFGEAVHKKYSRLWKDIEDQWDEFFPNIEVTVKVESKLRRSGLTIKPPRPE